MRTAGCGTTVDEEIAAVGAVADGKEESSFVRSITFCGAGAGSFGIARTGAVDSVEETNEGWLTNRVGGC